MIVSRRYGSRPRPPIGPAVALAVLVWAAGFAAGAAQPYRAVLDPFAVERSDASRYVNPFGGGLAQPRIGLRDVDGDGDPDLLAMNPDYTIRLYRNDGGLRFTRMTTTPYDGLVLRSWFRLADVDGDGADELFTSGGLSELLEYHNNGTATAPHYVPVPDTLRRGDTVIYTQQETVPSFCDIDADGDPDLFSGNTDGSITSYQNIGTATAPRFTFSTANYMGILVISPGEARKRDDGRASTTRRHGASVLDFADIDADGDLDILFGDFFTRKMLTFTNTGTRSAAHFSMSRLDTAFAPNGDEVISFGFNQPVSADIDGDGDQDVLVSSLYPLSVEQPIVLYENTAGSGHPMRMQRRDADLASEIDLGTYAAPAPIADAVRRGLLVGSSDGTITYIAASESGGATTWRIDARWPTDPSVFNAIPAVGDIDADGSAEVVVGDANNGALRLFRFDGNQLRAAPWALDTFRVNGFSAPAFGDVDEDGDLDLLVGAGNGRFVLLENIGTPAAPIFARRTPPHPFDTLDVGANSALTFADVDHDGHADVIVGGKPRPTDLHGVLRFYLRRGDGYQQEPAFPPMVTALAPVPAMIAAPEGRFLICGTQDGGLLAWRDTTQASSVVTPPRPEGLRLAGHVVDGRDPLLRFEGNIHPPGASITLFDLPGRAVFRAFVRDGDRTLRLPRLAPGVYQATADGLPLGGILVRPQ